MSGVSLTQALLTSAITFIGLLVVQMWQGHRDRLNDERMLRDRRVERVRQLLGETITLLEEWNDILSRRCSQVAFGANSSVREEDLEPRYQASLRTCAKLQALLLLDGATAEFADRLYEAKFSFIGTYMNAGGVSQGWKVTSSDLDKGVRSLWTFLQRTAVRARDVLISIEQPLSRARFPLRRHPRALASVPPPHPLATEMRQAWLQEADTVNGGDAMANRL